MEVIAFLIALFAIFLARKANKRSLELSARLNQLEASVAGGILRETAPPIADTFTAPPISPESPEAPAPASPPPFRAAAPITSVEAPADTNSPDVSSPNTSPDQVGATRPGLEERLGTRWVVWIGGLTLALGGLFLVKYSIEAGLLGPGVRVLLGGLFALALLGGGELTRRKESASATAPSTIANIPAILTAAGTAVAFATVYAAYALYGFLAPPVAFGLLGLVTLGTLAAALLHGPALAGLGVIGAFITPVLVSSDAPDHWALYIYIAIVTAAAFGLARIRLWRWLALTTIAFDVVWMLFDISRPETLAPHAFDIIVSFALAALLVVTGFMFGPSSEPGRIEPVSSLSLTAFLFGATALVLTTDHSSAALIVFALLIAATIAIAWRAESATGSIGAAALFVFVVFAEWAIRANPDLAIVPGGAMPGIGARADDGSINLHLITASGFAAAFGMAGFLAQGRSISAIVPVVWAAAGVFTPLALLVALYARIAHLDRSIPFAVIAIALSAAFAGATELLTKRDARPGQMISTALFATGTLAALALAFTFALEKGWLTIALALMSLGTAWISMKRPIPFLRSLAAILAGIVVLRIGYEPRIVGSDVGTTPIFNWLLLGYGIPALSFWTASIFMRRRADDAPLRAVESAAILFTVLLAFVEIRHFINNGDIYRASSGLTEVALQVCVALAMALGLERLRVRSRSIIHNIAAILLTVLAGIAIVGGLFVLENPMIWPIRVEGAFVNVLLLGYAMPAVLALLLSYAVAGRRPAAYGNTIAAGALALALAYVTFQIRRLYHGPLMSSGTTFDVEQYTYSVAWLALGVILLGAGLLLPSQRARFASAVIIALTILKVFLIDMSNLTGAYRAFSFIGLGLVLVAIGWLYQRLLFRQTVPPATPAAGS
ncbi:putative membrane protein [Nitrobacteraceae bacterium AZCC 1564]